MDERGCGGWKGSNNVGWWQGRVRVRVWVWVRVRIRWPGLPMNLKGMQMRMGTVRAGYLLMSLMHTWLGVGFGLGLGLGF